MRHPHRALPERITVEWLRDIRACKSEVGRFETEWPDGVEPSIEALERAHEIGLDLGWLAEAVVSEGTVADVRRFLHRQRDAVDAYEAATYVFREAWNESTRRIYDTWRQVTGSSRTVEECNQASREYGNDLAVARDLLVRQTTPFLEARERDLLAIYLDVLFPEVEAAVTA